MSIKGIFFPHDHRKDHHKSLDGLRGWAVLLVLFGHAANQGLAPWIAGGFLTRGKLGVYLFFLISAYLLDKQIISVWMQGRSNLGYWRYYLLRRVLRIFPPFIAALFVFRFANEIGLKVVIQDLNEMLEHVTLRRGDHIFWSIPTEFKYYLFSPVLIFVFARFFKWNKTAVYTTLISGILATVICNIQFDLPRFSTLRYLSVFLIGTGLAFLETQSPKGFKQILSHSMSKFIAPAALVLLVFWGQLATNFTHPSVYLPAAILWGLLLLASKREGWWSAFLSWTPFRFIGTISYSLYLLHIPVLMWVKTLDIQPLAQFICFIVLSVVVAVLSHLCIERPALKLVTKNL